MNLKFNGIYNGMKFACSNLIEKKIPSLIFITFTFILFILKMVATIRKTTNFIGKKLQVL